MIPDKTGGGVNTRDVVATSRKQVTVRAEGSICGQVTVRAAIAEFDLHRMTDECLLSKSVGIFPAIIWSRVFKLTRRELDAGRSFTALPPTDRTTYSRNIFRVVGRGGVVKHRRGGRNFV